MKSFLSLLSTELVFLTDLRLPPAVLPATLDRMELEKLLAHRSGFPPLLLTWDRPAGREAEAIGGGVAAAAMRGELMRGAAPLRSRLRPPLRRDGAPP